MTDRRTASTITDAELDQLYDDLARANEAARRALAQRQEMAEERYIWQERGDRAEAAIERVRRAVDSVKAAGRGHTPTSDHDKGVATAVDWVTTRVLEAIDARLVNHPAPAPAATEATGRACQIAARGGFACPTHDHCATCDKEQPGA